MLRNITFDTKCGHLPLLNEVLSLNAQESGFAVFKTAQIIILNEVLSLNAQESVMWMRLRCSA